MDYKKILIIRLSAIGDVVHTTIIPYSIKQKHPNCEIHYLTKIPSIPIIENCPYIDKKICFDGNLNEMIKQLRAEKYDCIITLNFTIKTYLLTFLSFPKHIIFKTGKGTSWVDNYFNTAKKAFKDIEKPARLYLENLDENVNNKISNEISKYPKPYIFINPGRKYNNARQGRVWNIEKWNVLTNLLLSNFAGTIFVVGSSEEREYHKVLEKENVVILSGQHCLKETCKALSMADLMISGDSGPIHIASAYNVKTLAILGSTSPQKIKPYGENGFYVEPKNKCKYCWKKKCKYTSEFTDYTPCIESISPEDVIDKILSCKLL